mgnify:FL=1
MSSNVYFTFTSIILLGSIFSLFSLIDDCIILKRLKRDDTISIEENKYLKRLLVKNILVILNILFIDFFLISFLDYIVKLEFLNMF